MMSWDPSMVDPYGAVVDVAEFVVFFVVIPFVLVALFSHIESMRIRRDIRERMEAIEEFRRRREEAAGERKERPESGRKEQER